MEKDHEQQRKKLWCDVYVAYVTSANSTSSEYGKNWADKALQEFDKRFPKPNEDLYKL